MIYKGVVFDFNGTLFWDTGFHDQAWDTFLHRYGLSLTDNEKHETLHGKNNKDILETLFGRQLPYDEITRFVIEKEAIYQQICLQQKMELAPGAVDFLNFLMSNNIQHTIATASGIENVDFYFEHLGLSNWFNRSEVVFNNGSIKGKPDPEIFLTAMRAMNLDPRDAVIFEDSVTGITAAENSHAGKIIIVNSAGADYSRWNHTIIQNFSDVDRSIFLKK